MNLFLPRRTSVRGDILTVLIKWREKGFLSMEHPIHGRIFQSFGPHVSAQNLKNSYAHLAAKEGKRKWELVLRPCKLHRSAVSPNHTFCTTASTYEKKGAPDHRELEKAEKALCIKNKAKQNCEVQKQYNYAR